MSVYGKGWVRDLPDHRDFKVAYQHLSTLPSSVDLRSQMPEVYDQAQSSSCTGNAIAAAIHYRLIAQQLPIFNPSRLFIYFNEREMENSVSSDSGAQIRDGIKSVVDLGVCSEVEWPFDLKQLFTKPLSGCYTDALQNIVESYASLGQNLPTLKTALVQGYPIIFGATLYDSFESDKVAQTGLVPMPDKSESCLGGHAILLVGYSDDKHCFIVRNSWGSSWGDGGYCYMSYNYILNSDLCSDFWIIKLVK